MIAAAQTLIDPSAAPYFGIAALAARMTAPLFARRETILIAQLTASCCSAASYALMGQQTAAGVCLIGATQTTVALIAGERSWQANMGYVFLPIALAVSALTFSGLPTILAAMACCLMMIGRMQQDLMRMRRIQLCACPFGAAHDIVVEAWPALAGALMSFAIALIAFRREVKRAVSA